MVRRLLLPAFAASSAPCQAGGSGCVEGDPCYAIGQTLATAAFIAIGARGP